MINLTLPFPPSVNRYWRHTVVNGAPRTLISSDGRRFKQAVCETTMSQLPRPWNPLCTPLSVFVLLVPPDRRKRDLDNTAKALLDALTDAGVWQDDVQIKRLELAWAMIETVKGGSAKVRISELPVPRKMVFRR